MAVLLLQIRNMRNRPTLRNVSCVTRFSTSSGNSEGIQRRHPVRKAKLLSTVAAALLLSAGAASAQGMSKDSTPERAPAAQQNAPAEKVAPSMKGGEHKAPQTTGQATPNSGKGPQATGQATPDAKSGKARETTGQSPKSDMDQRGPGSAPQAIQPRERWQKPEIQLGKQSGGAVHKVHHRRTAQHHHRPGRRSRFSQTHNRTAHQDHLDHQTAEGRTGKSECVGERRNPHPG